MFGPHMETDAEQHALNTCSDPEWLMGMVVGFSFVTSRTRPQERSLSAARCRLSATRNRRERDGEAIVHSLPYVW